jgi:hypothetical protein
LPVTAAVEPVPLDFARGCLDRAGAVERGEGGLGVQPFGVIAGGDQAPGGGVIGDRIVVQQGWRCLHHQLSDVDAKLLDLLGERLVAARE